MPRIKFSGVKVNVLTLTFPSPRLILVGGMKRKTDDKRRKGGGDGVLAQRRPTGTGRCSRPVRHAKAETGLSCPRARRTDRKGARAGDGPARVHRAGAPRGLRWLGAGSPQQRLTAREHRQGRFQRRLCQSPRLLVRADRCTIRSLLHGKGMVAGSDGGRETHRDRPDRTPRRVGRRPHPVASAAQRRSFRAQRREDLDFDGYPSRRGGSPYG